MAAPEDIGYKVIMSLPIELYLTFYLSTLQQNWCFNNNSNRNRSTLTLARTFINHSTIVMSLILLLPMLASASENVQFVTLQEGQTGSVIFNLTWQPDPSSNVEPYYCLKFASADAPFYINGRIDGAGFKHESQQQRFAVHVSENSRSHSTSVNLTIHNVSIEDEGDYVLDFIAYGHKDHVQISLVVNVSVSYPIEQTECTIMMSNYASYKELHCHAPISFGDHATLSCFQNNYRMPYKGKISNGGTNVSGIFWIIDSDPVYCCCS